MNMKLRYKGTALGILWTVLEPIFIFAILYIVFTNLRAAREDYAIYLISGILLFNIFQKGTMGGLSSLQESGGLLKTLNINKEFFPVASTGTTLLFMIVQIGILFGLMGILQFHPSWTLILFPIPVVLLLLLILGLSYIFSIVFVYFEDIQPFWGVFVYGLLFVTPIFWYVDEGTGILSEFQKINPLGQIIEIFHKIIFGHLPSWSDWTVCSALVFGILFVGFAVFQKFQNGIIEEL